MNQYRLGLRVEGRLSPRIRLGATENASDCDFVRISQTDLQLSTIDSAASIDSHPICRAWGYPEFSMGLRRLFHTVTPEFPRGNPRLFWGNPSGIRGVLF